MRSRQYCAGGHAGQNQKRGTLHNMRDRKYAYKDNSVADMVMAAGYKEPVQAFMTLLAAVDAAWGDTLNATRARMLRRGITHVHPSAICDADFNVLVDSTPTLFSPVSIHADVVTGRRIAVLLAEAAPYVNPETRRSVLRMPAEAREIFFRTLVTSGTYEAGKAREAPEEPEVRDVPLAHILNTDGTAGRGYDHRVLGRALEKARIRPKDIIDLAVAGPGFDNGGQIVLFLHEADQVNVRRGPGRI